MPSSFSPAPARPSPQLDARPYRIAINGYGRIGRCYLRTLHEAGLSGRFSIVAINEPADLASIAYLTRFDSTHGRFPGKVEYADGQLVIDGHPIRVFHASSPDEIDWETLELDLVVECSGRYSTRDELQRFIDAGVPRLLLSHPGRAAEDVDATIVFGVNHQSLDRTQRLVSAASCTTNAVVPVLERLDATLGVENVLLSTLHSVMNDQPLIDAYHHSDLRRTRSAMQSIVPVSTGLARGVERLLPQLKDRVSAKAVRVPTLNVSAIDMVVSLTRQALLTEVDGMLRAAAEGRYQNLLALADEPYASIDFNHDPRSAIIDGAQSRMVGPRLLNLLVWFDNEWGFANRMADLTRYWLDVSARS